MREAHTYVATMEIRVLGPVEVIEAGNRVDLGGKKQKAVLAMLVTNAGKPLQLLSPRPTRSSQ